MPHEINVYRLHDWVQLNAVPFEDPDSAILFAMAQPHNIRMVVTVQQYASVTIRNGLPERTIMPFCVVNHRKPSPVTPLNRPAPEPSS